MKFSLAPFFGSSPVPESRKPSLPALFFILLALLPFSAFAAPVHKAAAAAPDFTLPTGRGTVALSDYRGKVVLVDFWASWCAPCRQSFPWMSSMLARYSSQGLVILAVNLDKKGSSADRFLEEFPVPFTVAFDPDGKTPAAFHVQAMPSSYLVSRTGQIVYRHEGFEPAKTQQIEAEIKEALSQ